MELNTNWKFRNVKDEHRLEAWVPGTVHTDLYANKVIDDPFYRTNEKALQWIDKEDWEYSICFIITADIYSRNKIELIFKGLDTYADIYINGTLLAKTDNMFREWILECKSVLKTGENELTIVFHSAIKVGLEKLALLGYPLPATNDLSELGGLEDKKVSVFSRKPGYHFGWDWGPRFVTSGIWRPVYLSAWDMARICNIHYKLLQLTEDKALYRADWEIEATAGYQALIQIASSSDPAISAEIPITLNKGSNRVAVNFEILNPRLWWSNGLGEAALYNLTALLLINDHPVDQKDTRIGVRSVRVVQKPDTRGKSFYVELNGIPVFMKGANYIPNDNFIPRVTREDYEKIVKAAYEANMNMLRVWGGGFYEEDLFYDLCDQYGILIWQDFMFGCAMYPGDKAFLENVREEAIQNVKRLRNHPCIALWCGNNEIHSAWAPGEENQGWEWKKIYSHEQQEEIGKTYDKLFHHIIPEVVDEYAQNSFYWPSSPLAADGKLATFNSPSGDIHYWGVWHAKHPFTEFNKNIGRFVSEYGFQSFPEMKTIKSFTIPEDWNIHSEVMEFHQRSGNGNTRIKEYMAEYYKIPTDFSAFLYVSQLLQAEGIRTAIDAHRSNMPYCMGSLFWQLNDCWPVISWSSIDYFKRWKALQYYARAAYMPVILSPYIQDHAIEIYIISDRLLSFNGTLILQLLSFRGAVLNEITQEVSVEANSSNRVYTANLDSLTGNNQLNQVFLSAVLYEDTVQITRRLIYFTPLKEMDFPRVELKKQITRTPGGYKIRLTSDMLAKNVYLYTEKTEGFFTDNFFDLLPDENKEVDFFTKILIPDLEKDLRLLVLNNIY